MIFVLLLLECTSLENAKGWRLQELSKERIEAEAKESGLGSSRFRYWRSLIIINKTDKSYNGCRIVVSRSNLRNIWFIKPIVFEDTFGMSTMKRNDQNAFAFLVEGFEIKIVILQSQSGMSMDT